MKNTSSKQWKPGLIWVSIACCVSAILLIVGQIDASNGHTICVRVQGRTSYNLFDEPVVYRISGNFVDTGYVADVLEVQMLANGRYVGCLTTETRLNRGHYAIELAQDGTTDHLSNFENFVVNSYNKTVLDTDLLEGDANGDNTVSGADASILSSAHNIFFALCEGDNGYDARADFDENGCVTGADKSLFVSNFNRFFALKGETSPLPDGLFNQVIEDMSTRTGAAESQISVVDAIAVTWPSTALGCPITGGAILTTGYQITLQAGNQIVEYHTDSDDRFLVCS